MYLLGQLITLCRHCNSDIALRLAERGILYPPFDIVHLDYFDPRMALSGSRFRDSTDALAIPPVQRYTELNRLGFSKPMLPMPYVFSMDRTLRYTETLTLRAAPEKQTRSLFLPGNLLLSPLHAAYQLVLRTPIVRYAAADDLTATRSMLDNGPSCTISSDPSSSSATKNDS